MASTGLLAVVGGGVGAAGEAATEPPLLLGTLHIVGEEPGHCGTVSAIIIVIIIVKQPQA